MQLATQNTLDTKCLDGRSRISRQFLLDLIFGRDMFFSTIFISFWEFIILSMGLFVLKMNIYSPNNLFSSFALSKFASSEDEQLYGQRQDAFDVK